MADAIAKKTGAKKTGTKKTGTKKPGAKKPALPAALARVAKAAHAARVARLAKRGRAAIARIKERQSDVAASMVDIGEALVELKAEGVAQALGRGGFAEVVTRDLGMAVTTANALVALATRVSREFATKVGHGRATVLLELADATPEDDAPEDLFEARLTLPSGRVIDVPKATDREIREAAKELRDARPTEKARRGRGFTTSPEERAAYAVFERAFRTHAAGLSARTKLVATRDGKGPRVSIDLRFSELRALAAALRKALAE